MKKLLYLAVAAIAALSSCGNDDIINDNVNDNDNEKANATAFTATIEGEGETRTTIGTGSDDTHKMVNWSDGDQISINGSLYSTTSTSNEAEFTLVDGQTEADADAQSKYKAFYPASLYNGGTPTLPGVQTYAEGKFNMPMYAESSDKQLAFKNICGVLAIKVASGTVKSISVISDVTPLSGVFTVSGDAAVLQAPYSNRVILDCGEGVTANNTVFYVAVPAITSANLQITVSNGTPAEDKVAENKGVTIARNTIYSINFPASPTFKTGQDLYHAWVQFEATVKWATMNLGATAETGAGCFGDYYKWGSTDPLNNGGYPDYIYDIAGSTSDTANQTWGGASTWQWQMPKKEMFENLTNTNKYQWEKVGDFKANSYSGYNVYLKKTAEGATYNTSIDAHVFFPAAGYYNNSTITQKGTCGYYWSSIPQNSYNAYFLNFSSGNWGVNYNSKGRCHPVRAVLVLN